MADLDRAEQMRRLAGSLADRIEFVPAAPVSIINDISLGILFIMAFWSSPEVIQQHDPDRQLRLVVIDTDFIPEFYERFGEQLGGWGETFWIKEGNMLFDSGRGLNFECLEPNTIALLEAD